MIENWAIVKGTCNRIIQVSAFGNLLRCNCKQETHDGEVVSVLTHSFISVIGRHFYLIVDVYVTKLINKLCLKKIPVVPRV
jgi:hypothetical protein